MMLSLGVNAKSDCEECVTEEIAYLQLTENTTVRSIYPRIDAKMAELFPYSSVEDDWCKVYDEAAAWFSTEVMHQYGINFA